MTPASLAHEILLDPDMRRSCVSEPIAPHRVGGGHQARSDGITLSAGKFRGEGAPTRLMRACPLSGEVLSTAPNGTICAPSGLAANVRFCRKQDVRLVHAYAHVGMIIRDRSRAGGIRPSVDMLGPYFALKRCCLLNHTIPKLLISVRTARVAVHRVRLGNGPCSRVLRVRRPRQGYEPRGHRVDRNEIGALLAAGGLSSR
jgi:hypothetical protein